ncbi:MAG TPA: Ig-like domain-containing protein, partial [Verrucomicrobiae bacterium]|nr:Ig-like domain-containing protein [Verrucomicrobiae bacterium]
MQKGQFGWLTWSGNRSRQTLINSLTIPGDSYKYINTADTNDSQVSARNWVRNTQAENVQTVRAALDKIKKCEVVAPLWYQASSDKGAYRIGGFAKIQLLSYDLDSQDTITVRFNGMVNCDKGNDAPVVSAGEDLVVAFPNRAVLHGSVMDDGLPTGKELTALWSKVSGPGIVMFSNPRSPETLASFTDPGTYVLRLTGDDGSKSASDDVTVTLNFGNAAPVANAQTLDTVEDVSVNVTLTGSDADGDALTYILVSNPSFGTLDGTVPNLTYIPAPNVSGTDNFTFKVNDGVLDSEVATITINVAAVNDAPVAFNQSVSTDEDTAVAIVLSGNDVEGTALTFTIIDPPVHGVLSGTAPNLVYTPVPNYSGSDQFAFTVNDGALTSPSATVTLTVRPVNSAPIAQPDSLSLDEDGVVDILLRGSDAEGSPLTFSIVTPPAHGVLTGTPPAVRYVPSANYNGGDSFTFKVNDGTLDSAPALVTIAIAAVNDAPVALDDSVALDEDSNADLVLRGNDVEGNPLTFSILTPPAHGALSGTPPNVRYVPAGNYNGPDIFTFKANDGALDSAPATVSITVRPVNDVPVAVGAEVSLAEDSAADIVLTGTDVENSPLTFSIINHPAHGVLSGTPPAVRYVPAANYNGPDSFTFKVNDGVLDSAVATVNLVVQPVNDAPVASSASASLDEDTGVDLVLQGTDVEGSALTFAIVNPPAHGVLSGSPPAVRYVPSANYFGPDSFTFKVNDGSLDSTSATVSLTVNPVNDAP